MSQLISSPTTRNGWLKAIYKNGLVLASEETRNLADKVYAYHKVHEFLGERTHEFTPKTMGLKAFIKKHSLKNGRKLAHVSLIQKSLESEFPMGFIIKPVSIINSAGDMPGFYFFKKIIFESFSNENSLLHRAAMSDDLYRSELLSAVVSGEELLIQENIATKVGMTEQKAQSYSEIRVHTFESQVLTHSSYSRWKVNPVKEKEAFVEANTFVQEFLDLFPRDYLIGHAWALDILVINGKYQIIEINTNRGMPGQWSGYLSRPALIGAYTRHIERTKGIKFTGLSGVLLRSNLGNYFKYLKKYYFEGIR